MQHKCQTLLEYVLFKRHDNASMFGLLDNLFLSIPLLLTLITSLHSLQPQQNLSLESDDDQQKIGLCFVLCMADDTIQLAKTFLALQHNQRYKYVLICSTKALVLLLI